MAWRWRRRELNPLSKHDASERVGFSSWRNEIDAKKGKVSSSSSGWSAQSAARREEEIKFTQPKRYELIKCERKALWRCFFSFLFRSKANKISVDPIHRSVVPFTAHVIVFEHGNASIAIDSRELRFSHKSPHKGGEQINLWPSTEWAMSFVSSNAVIMSRHVKSRDEAKLQIERTIRREKLSVHTINDQHNRMYCGVRVLHKGKHNQLPLKCSRRESRRRFAVINSRLRHHNMSQSNNRLRNLIERNRFQLILNESSLSHCPLTSLHVLTQFPFSSFSAHFTCPIRNKNPTRTSPPFNRKYAELMKGDRRAIDFDSRLELRNHVFNNESLSKLHWDE